MTTTGNDVHINGEYERDPWGYLGMTVCVYRARADGGLYAMRDARGVIATARTMDALADLARRERWVATYRHVTADGREIWVSIPE
jgi:hypothetical protein